MTLMAAARRTVVGNTTPDLTRSRYRPGLCHQTCAGQAAALGNCDWRYLCNPGLVVVAERRYRDMPDRSCQKLWEPGFVLELGFVLVFVPGLAPRFAPRLALVCPQWLGAAHSRAF